jgi:oleate hydratase
MPHSASTANGRGFIPPNAHKTHAYLVGGGIASLAAAADLIHYAHVPASQIHILESSSLPGGSMDASGTPSTGYIMRGGRMLNLSYICLYNLLYSIPSLKVPNITVLDEIANFNIVEGNKTHAKARVIVERMHGMGPGIADATDFQLSGKDRVELMKMTVEGEKRLMGKKIEDFFDEEFFESNFWIMWATM